MLLTDLSVAYIAERNKQKPIGREMAKRSVENLTTCAKAYSHWLGHSARIADLRSETINAFLVWMVDDGYSPYTIKSRRTLLMILWRFAWRLRMTRKRVEEIRTVFCPELEIHGYTLDQAEALLNRLPELVGIVRRTKIPRNLYWGSLVPTKWDVCLRLGDFTHVEIDHFDASGKRLWIQENKTRKQGWERLSDTSVDAIQKCIDVDCKRRYIWPGMKAKSLSREFTRIAREFGFPGSANWIRKGASSECDRRHPGQGWLLLRHSTPKIFPKHYRVSEICDQDKPTPPPLMRRGA